MTFNNYTQKSLEAVQSAQNIAVQHSNQQLEQIHLLLALLQQERGLTPQLLQKMGVNTEDLEAAAGVELQKLPAVTVSREADRFYVSTDVDATFRAAEQQAQHMKDEFISVEHLLLALIEAAKGSVKNLFEMYRITSEDALQALQSIRGSQRVTTDNSESTYDALEKIRNRPCQTGTGTETGSSHRQG